MSSVIRNILYNTTDSHSLSYCYSYLTKTTTVWMILLKFPGGSVLTDCGRVTHISVSKPAIIGSDNGLSTGRRQAIIGTNAGILLIGPLGTNFSENVIETCIFSCKKMHLEMSPGKWRPFCLGLNVLTTFSVLYAMCNQQHSCYVHSLSIYVSKY